MTSDRSQAESLDEESLDLDPLEAGVEPPERWAEATNHGTTPNEAREGESLDSKLAEEEPDIPVPDPEAPAEDADRLEGGPEEAPPVDRLHRPPTEAAGRGQSADEAGGSVAKSLREDHPE
ncbi:hypothetical protein [Actinokineospora sp. UTMC 2448]|uniref:hypothetical protein n=1 Tax=Actinokineospora sp. UTMC 2448 TaxID=2268449 RepID=UPI00216409C6|nr:hypothetical protein [Actinokineospora sp. UTMC 2448]UVS79909.1 hypothetical protein Actkin_03659 [Actinokineospora sp. UTMC 2448]